MIQSKCPIFDSLNSEVSISIINSLTFDFFIFLAIFKTFTGPRFISPNESSRAVIDLAPFSSR